MKHWASLLVGITLLAGCRNWDLMRPPEESGGTGERAFTRLDPDEPGPLTSEVARRRIVRIQAANGRDRLELIETFFSEFPEARLLSMVHGMAGEAHLALDDAAAAAAAFQRSLELTRTDLLGLPLDAVLPLQLGMAMLGAQQPDQGIEWLWRASLVDRGERITQALRWAYAERAIPEPFAGWLRDGRRAVAVAAPDFELPGLQASRLGLEAVRGKATMLNFWSPT